VVARSTPLSAAARSQLSDPDEISTGLHRVPVAGHPVTAPETLIYTTVTIGVMKPTIRWIALWHALGRWSNPPGTEAEGYRGSGELTANDKNLMRIR